MLYFNWPGFHLVDIIRKWKEKQTNAWKQNIAGNANEMFGFDMNPINLETFSPKKLNLLKTNSDEGRKKPTEIRNVWHKKCTMWMHYNASNENELDMNVIHLKRIQCSIVSMVMVHNPSHTHTPVNQLWSVWGMEYEMCESFMGFLGVGLRDFELGSQWYNTTFYYLYSVEMMQSSNVHAKCTSNGFLSC